MEAEVEQVDPHKKVDVGSFRLDGNGNVKQNLVNEDKLLLPITFQILSMKVNTTN